ncbi:hypothetical protein SKAU_G00300400, partial [Synaphobranchus kaupii]
HHSCFLPFLCLEKKNKEIQILRGYIFFLLLQSEDQNGTLIHPALWLKTPVSWDTVIGRSIGSDVWYRMQQQQRAAGTEGGGAAEGGGRHGEDQDIHRSSPAGAVLSGTRSK